MKEVKKRRKNTQAINIYSDRRVEKNVKRKKKTGVRKKKPVGQGKKVPLEQFGSDFYTDEFAEKRKRQSQFVSKTAPARKPLTPVQRKIKKIIIYCTVLTIVLVIGIVLSLTVLFKTEEYAVYGNTLYNESDIIEVCGIFKGENIFLANKGDAEKNLEERFAYIENADVSFKIPNKITINITEAKQAYVVQVSGQYYLISVKGRILEQTDKKPVGLPVYKGPNLTNTTVGQYAEFEEETTSKILNEVMDCLSSNNISDVTEIDVSSTSNVQFVYDNRIRIILGVPEDLEYKVRTAIEVITTHLDPQNLRVVTGELDVSSCNGTKKSYFDEKPIEVATEPVTEAATEPVTEPTANDSYDDYSNIDGYSYDDYSYDDYSNDDGYSNDYPYDDSYDWYSNDDTY